MSKYIIAAALGLMMLSFIMQASALSGLLFFIACLALIGVYVVRSLF
jgi:hypothetical protein